VRWTGCVYPHAGLEVPRMHLSLHDRCACGLTLDRGTKYSMLTECSPNAHSLARSLFGQPRHGRNSMLQKLCLRHLSERGSGGGGSDWGSWREEDFLRLTRTWGPGGLRGPSSMLVCRANPPVWSCRVGRLPAMQLDGRQKWRGAASVHWSSSHRGATANWLPAEAQSW
jgi:hypothetical protein